MTLTIQYDRLCHVAFVNEKDIKMISGFFKRQECLVIILIMKSDNFNSLFQAYEKKKNKYVPEIQHFDKMSFATQETNNEVRCNVYKRSTFKNRWH